jgi:hypothetical protein
MNGTIRDLEMTAEVLQAETKKVVHPKLRELLGWPRLPDGKVIVLFHPLINAQIFIGIELIFFDRQCVNLCIRPLGGGSATRSVSFEADDIVRHGDTHQVDFFKVINEEVQNLEVSSDGNFEFIITGKELD